MQKQAQTTHEANDHRKQASIVQFKRKAHILCEQHFSILLNCLMVVKMLLKCTIRSQYFHWYTLPNFCTQISRPLAYGVRNFSKASATTVYSTFLDSCPLNSLNCLFQLALIFIQHLPSWDPLPHYLHPSAPFPWMSPPHPSKIFLNVPTRATQGEGLGGL